MSRPLVSARIVDRLLKNQDIADETARCTVRLKAITDIRAFISWLYDVNESAARSWFG